MCVKEREKDRGLKKSVRITPDTHVHTRARCACEREERDLHGRVRQCGGRDCIAAAEIENSPRHWTRWCRGKYRRRSPSRSFASACTCPRRWTRSCWRSRWSTWLLSGVSPFFRRLHVFLFLGCPPPPPCVCVCAACVWTRSHTADSLSPGLRAREKESVLFTTLSLARSLHTTHSCSADDARACYSLHGIYNTVHGTPLTHTHCSLLCARHAM